MVKNLLQCRRPQFDPWVGKIPWKRERLPTPVFLPGGFHGERSLVGYSPWGCKESDVTEQPSVTWHDVESFSESIRAWYFIGRNVFNCKLNFFSRYMAVYVMYLILSEIC